ncbi:MAG: HAD-IB family hydrolase [Nocardioidaceae bacterium]|nr:HAD-IB family hydrolase [Nocardioidaceae bacterium]NUS52930.1 HAD-IB family hydrolase [Nocardioidaceae bacterium]
MTGTDGPVDRVPDAGESRTGRLPRRSTGRPAAFFDLDKTIIAKSSTLAFSKPFQAGGLISRRAVLRSAYAQFVYLVGGADHDQMEKMREFLSDLSAGWDVQTVRDIVAETLHHIVDPLVYDEAVSLIEEHHLAGRDVIIVSASGAEVVEPIGEMLGADGVIATRMEIAEGRYTGTIDYYAYAENKAQAIKDLALQQGYDLARSYAYSDSVTDVHMLEVVGHPYAVNPDKELRRHATERGWPVLVFNRPVTLRSRMRLPQSKPTLAALALGTAAAVGGALYLAARRRIGRNGA